jgi:hypothetical protein
MSSILSSIWWDKFASEEDRDFTRKNRVDYVKDYNILKKLFSIVDKYKEELRVDIKNTLFADWLDDDADFFVYLDDLLNPRKNDIELITFENFTKQEIRDSEVWFNDECLLIRKNNLEEIMGKL